MTLKNEILRQEQIRVAELEAALRDIQGFCAFALEHQIKAGEICATIGHDCGGLIANERCFSPRTFGHAKYLS